MTSQTCRGPPRAAICSWFTRGSHSSTISASTFAFVLSAMCSAICRMSRWTCSLSPTAEAGLNPNAGMSEKGAPFWFGLCPGGEGDRLSVRVLKKAFTSVLDAQAGLLVAAERHIWGHSMDLVNPDHPAFEALRN